jgi:hypothetical protein
LKKKIVFKSKKSLMILFKKISGVNSKHFELFKKIPPKLRDSKQD